MYHNDPRLCPMFSFNSLSRTIDELSAIAFKDSPVSAAHGHLLLVVIGNPMLTLSELAAIMNLKPSTMTRFIDKLQRQGLVERHGDGRKVRILATDAAIQLEPTIATSIELLRSLYVQHFGEVLTDEIFKLCTQANAITYEHALLQPGED